jgi:hypothetical protein
MKFRLDIECSALDKKIEHPSSIYLMGSCFAENIAHYLKGLKYNVLSNPHGILYNAKSLANSIERVINKQPYTAQDLIERDGLYHSFDFHSSFSGADKEAVLDMMNTSIQDAHNFLSNTEYVIITLGTSFVYKHIERAVYVGNNHKFPAAHFTKELLTTQDNVTCLQQIINQIRTINPTVQFIFSVSPVRHIRDGVMENNMSKAHLISAVHLLKKEGYYFPAYEIVIDVLRDYRFYKSDLVHPSNDAITVVADIFSENCLSEKDALLRKRISQLNKNLAHRPLHPESQSYKAFEILIQQQKEELKSDYPNINFD